MITLCNCAWTDESDRQIYFEGLWEQSRVGNSNVNGCARPCEIGEQKPAPSPMNGCGSRSAGGRADPDTRGCGQQGHFCLERARNASRGRGSGDTPARAAASVFRNRLIAGVMKTQSDCPHPHPAAPPSLRMSLCCERTASNISRARTGNAEA